MAVAAFDGSGSGVMGGRLMVVVVVKEEVGCLLMLPKSSVSKRRRSFWEGRHENDMYIIIILCLITVLWCSGNNAISSLCNPSQCVGSILAHALTF